MADAISVTSHIPTSTWWPTARPVPPRERVTASRRYRKYVLEDTYGWYGPTWE